MTFLQCWCTKYQPSTQMQPEAHSCRFPALTSASHIPAQAIVDGARGRGKKEKVELEPSTAEHRSKVGSKKLTASRLCWKPSPE